VIFTIGYEGLSIGEFVDILSTHGIQVLIDVRELPLSRKPGFSKAALSSAVQEAGMEYRHERELGAPREVRYELRLSGDWATYRKAYLESIEDKNGILKTLVNSKKKVCLMCFEEDYRICHRSLIIERMVGLGLVRKFKHINLGTENLAFASLGR